MFELPDEFAVSIMLRRLLVLAAAKEVGVIVVKALIVACEVPVM